MRLQASKSPTSALSGSASQSSELGNYGHSFYPGDPISHTDSFPDVVNDLATTVCPYNPPRRHSHLRWLETTHFSAQEQTNPAINTLHADPDADGAPNIFECLSGTDPRNSAEKSSLTAAITDNHLTVRFIIRLKAERTP